MGGRPLASAKGSRGGHGSSLCQPFPRINPGQFGRRAWHQRGQPVNCCPLQRRTKAASLDRSEDGYFSLPLAHGFDWIRGSRFIAAMHPSRRLLAMVVVAVALPVCVSSRETRSSGARGC
jgi:hypothetical protein